MSGRKARAAGVAGLVMFALAMPGGAWAGAAGTTDAIYATAGGYDGLYAGGGGPAGEFRLVAGQQPTLFNSDLTAEHNVVAIADGPDGDPAFANSLVYSNQSAPVEGTQYLQPGPYEFYCTIHTEMHGTLLVSGPGAVPRPDVAVEVASKKLKKLGKGKLKVSVTATSQSDDVSVEARVAGKPAGTASGIDLAANQKQTLTLKLGKQAKKEVKAGLKKGRKVAVSVSSTVPFGAPDSAKTKLK